MVLLMFNASASGNPEVFKLFLDKGAEVNAKDFYGNTALGFASKKGHRKIKKCLSSQGQNDWG